MIMGRTSKIAWTSLPISTNQKYDENIEIVTIKTLKHEKDCHNDFNCQWYEKSLIDGSWIPLDVINHEVFVKTWNNLFTNFTIYVKKSSSIHTTSGLVLTSNLIQSEFSHWFESRSGGEGEIIADYLTLQLSEVVSGNFLRMSTLYNLNTASNWEEFSQGLQTPKFPFQWQFLYADESNNIGSITISDRFVFFYSSHLLFISFILRII